MSDVKLEIDFWKTDFHGVEKGIRQDEQHRAKSSQFTKDMDIIGDVKKDGELYGYVAVRKEPLEEKESSRRRLVVKYFSKTMNWRATIEEVVSASLSNSLIIDEVSPVFRLSLARNEYEQQLMRVHPRRIGGGAHFALTFIHKDDGKDEGMFTLLHFDAKKLTLGEDFDVKNAAGKKVAKVDSKSMNIGGKVEVRYGEEIKSVSGLGHTLVLFACYLKYDDEVKKIIEDQMKDYKEGKFGKLDRIELGTLRKIRRGGF